MARNLDQLRCRNGMTLTTGEDLLQIVAGKILFTIQITERQQKNVQGQRTTMRRGVLLSRGGIARRKVFERRTAKIDQIARRELAQHEKTDVVLSTRSLFNKAVLSCQTMRQHNLDVPLKQTYQFVSQTNFRIRRHWTLHSHIDLQCEG